ncbi:MAG TPA: polyprenyl synthetase family protein, partial [Opitutus sp.]|nr:polyprenyl synthetase family protein [Opitutus sp.]
ERPAQLSLRLAQMNELGVFEAVHDAVQAEIGAACAALQEWPGEPPTPLLLSLCDVLRGQLAALRPARG